MNPTKKTILIAAIAIVCISAVTLAIVKAAGKNSLPDMAQMSPEEVREFMESEEFKNLDHRQHRNYMRTAMEHRSAKEAIAFFNTPNDMKNAYLDDVIEKMKEHMEDISQFRRPFDPNNIDEESRTQRQAERQRRSSPENQRLRRQATDPAIRVMQKNLRRAIAKRMSQQQ